MSRLFVDFIDKKSPDAAVKTAVLGLFCFSSGNSGHADGSFEVTWQWWTEYKEFEVAKVWWKTEIIMEKLLYLRKFDEL